MLCALCVIVMIGGYDKVNEAALVRSFCWTLAMLVRWLECMLLILLASIGLYKQTPRTNNHLMCELVKPCVGNGLDKAPQYMNK